MAWTGATVAVIFTLASGKTRTGEAVGNPVLITEGKVTFIDGVFAVVVLVSVSSTPPVGGGPIRSRDW